MKKLIILFLLALVASLFSCKEKESSCYDSSLVHNNACTADCPGVIGCDGKTYCNECEAHRQGIRVNP